MGFTPAVDVDLVVEGVSVAHVSGELKSSELVVAEDV